MKSLALLAAAGGVIISVTLASAHSRPVPSAASTMQMRLEIPSLHGLQIRRVELPLSSVRDGSSTATPTASPSGTPVAGPTGTPVPPSPTPSPTTSPYPDPVNLLQTAITNFTGEKSTHYQDIYHGLAPGTETLTVTGTGVASCLPGNYVIVKGTDKSLSTGKAKKVHYAVLQRKKTYWKKPLSGAAKKRVWTKVSAAKTAAYGVFGFDNPLACAPVPSSSGSGSGSGSGGSSPLKALVNLGPATYHGIATWHIQGIESATDSQGNVSNSTIDFYISKSHPLPYGYKVTVKEASQNVTITFEQVMSQFGKKVSLPTAKNPSKKHKSSSKKGKH